jgi:hypothetical protein
MICRTVSEESDCARVMCLGDCTVIWLYETEIVCGAALAAPLDVYLFCAPVLYHQAMLFYTVTERR